MYVIKNESIQVLLGGKLENDWTNSANCLILCEFYYLGKKFLCKEK